MKLSSVLFLTIAIVLLFIFLPEPVAVLITVPISVAVLCDLNGRHLYGDNYKMSDAPDR